MADFVSVTLPDSATKLRFKEPLVSEAQNLKDSGIVPPGIFRGYTPVANPGFLLDVDIDSAKGDSVAAVETLQNFNLTVRSVAKVTLDMTGQSSFPVFVVLRTKYEISPSPLTGLTTSEIKVVDTAVDNLDPLKLHDDDIKICRVIGFAGTTPNISTTPPDDRNEHGGPLLTPQSSPILFSGSKQATQTVDQSVSGTVDVPGTTVTYTLTKPQLVMIMVTSGGYRHVFTGQLSEAFLRVDGVDHQIGHVSGSDGGDTLVESGQASGFVFELQGAGVHTVSLRTSVNFASATLFEPISVLVLAGEAIS